MARSLDRVPQPPGEKMSEAHKQRIREARIQAETAVDRVVAMLLSRERDAGWNGMHPLGAFHEFQGHRPERSGFSGFSKVWEQTCVLNDWPERYQRAYRLVFKLSGSYREAVLFDRLCRGKYRRPGSHADPVLWTDEDIAGELGISRANFRQRVSRGYRQLILLVAPDLKAGQAPEQVSAAG